MVLVEDRLGELDVLLDLARLLPRNAQHPVEIVPHHGRLGRHRAHAAELLDLLQGLLAGFLAEFGLLDALFELGCLVATLLVLPELLLDRLHLLVEIVLALRLLHLPLDAVADPALDLQDADLAFHEAADLLQPAADRADLQQVLLVGDLQRRWAAMLSASLATSSIWLTETRTSGGIFLLSLMYSSNCDTAVRLRASSSRGRRPRRHRAPRRPGRSSGCRHSAPP